MNLNQIEKEKKEIIANFKPVEMEAYIKSLITNLYDAYLEQDSEKALTSKKLIEEATDIYLAEGYVNSLSKELEFRLAKANEVLITTLEDKDKLEANLSGIIRDNIYSNDIDLLSYSNSILTILIASYEKEPSENLLATIKEIAERVEIELTSVKYLLEDNNLNENEDPVEEVEILQELYLDYENSVRKINSF